MKRTIKVMVASVAMVVVGSAPVLAMHPIEYGTDGDDKIIGTNYSGETIYAKGGRDVVNGRGNSDIIHGGPGNDGGDDRAGMYLMGDSPSPRANSALDGDDRVYGEGGMDDLWGFGGSDLLSGGAGNDRIYAGEDRWASSTDPNEPPRKVLTENPGTDAIRGGGGNDQVFARDGRKDVIDCGDGANDIAIFDAGLDRVAVSCEIKNPRYY